MKPAVVLLSGGLDSATTLAIARSQGYEAYALSFAYGQRHSRELDSAGRVATALGAKNRLVLTLDQDQRRSGPRSDRADMGDDQARPE